MSSAARAWLEGLAARGVTVSLRGNRLELRPPSAYKLLTDDELITLRHHREDIKAIVRAGLPCVAPATPAGNAVVPTPAPAPCPYCKRACVGPEHFAYSTLHYDDPIEVQKRDAEATAVMMKQFGKPLPDWYR